MDIVFIPPKLVLLGNGPQVSLSSLLNFSQWNVIFTILVASHDSVAYPFSLVTTELGWSVITGGTGEQIFCKCLASYYSYKTLTFIWIQKYL